MSAGRLSRDGYFAVAMDILVEQGREGLTIAELCARLGVTKGSFYHHFANIDQFISAFLDDWKAGFQAAFEEFAAITDPAQQFEYCWRQALDVWTHGSETAMRAWAHEDAAVRSALAWRDQAAEDSYEHAVAQVIDDPVRARLLTRMSMYLFLGAQVRGRADRDHLVAVIAEATRGYFGVDVDIVEENGVPYLRVPREAVAR